MDPNLVRLVEAYRAYGHLKACLDPLHLKNGSTLHSESILSPHSFGLPEDAGKVFEVRDVLSGASQTQHSLSEVVEYLEGMYCGTMALQTAHMSVSSVCLHATCMPLVCAVCACGSVLALVWLLMVSLYVFSSYLLQCCPC